MIVTLIGNPNSGKTTLFNQLTGEDRKTGNWMGVTVEPYEATFHLDDLRINLVDLPGCYDADACGGGLDEQAAYEYLQLKSSQAFINVIEMAQLERGLFLTKQLLAQNIPVLVMITKTQKTTIDTLGLEKQLGCPVVTDITELKTRLVESLKAPARLPRQVAEVSVPEMASYRWTNRIDRVVLNRVLAMPLFFALMYTVFVFCVHVSGIFQDFFDLGSKAIFIEAPRALLVSWNAPEWLVGLLAFGAGQGINITISFIPIIAALFFALTFLESSGYMARAAFVLDRVMQWIGLPGKAFVPMIIGFGCNVPAVMASRTLSTRHDRILTVLMTPFMSCGARLAIYALFASAFFPKSGSTLIFALYLVGIIVALFTAFVLKKTLLQGAHSPLLMELPAYECPTLGFLARMTWNRLKRFLVRAGTLIVPLCALIGVSFSFQSNTLEMLAKPLTPIFSPMGIKEDNWPATVGLLTGVIAKEVVAGTLNALYLNEVRTFEPASETLRQAWKSVPENIGRLSYAIKHPVLASMKGEPAKDNHVMVERFGSLQAAFAYLLFVLLYMPCVSVLAIIARELKKSWAIFALGWTTGIAYCSAVFFYQCALLWEHFSWEPLGWISGLLGALFISVYTMRAFGKKQKRYIPITIA